MTKEKESTQKKRSKKLNDVEKKKKNKERMRKAREAMRNDPQAYEEMKIKERERYHRRVQAGKIKKIKDMPQRTQRVMRKKWRESTRKCRESKRVQEEIENRLIEDSPPLSPARLRNEALSVPDDFSHQKESGKKRARKNRRDSKRKIENLEEKIKQLEAKCNRYKVKLHRQKKVSKATPRKLVKEMLKGSNVTEKVRKALLFGEVLKTQVRENYLSRKSLADKQQVINSMSGDIVQKYRYTTYLSTIISRRRKNKKRMEKKANEQVRSRVEEFFLKDENSRLCAGKKECITRKKEKRQKRYMNDSILGLFRKFKEENPNTKIEYNTFRRYRPFWVVKPKKRDTCLCTHHENIELMVEKLHQLKIIREVSSTDVIKNACCNDQTENCRLRKCTICKTKTINYTLDEADENDDTTYERWINKKEWVVIKGKEKLCQKTRKEVVRCSKKELLTIFLGSVDKFLFHVNNILHQYKVINKIKQKLNENEFLMHMDFSENYQTKYHSEVQSAHFGGSKDQLSLHTVVTYYRPVGSDDVKTLSSCTVTENLRHDAVAICVHLYPVLKEIKRIVPNLKTAHFLSDSPSTQYRNRHMFFLIGIYLAEQLKCERLMWHYSESGHGKGAPDGVGGCLKRTADTLVNQSKDIVDCSSFKNILQEHCPGIKILGIDLKQMDILDKKMPDKKVFPPVKGTMSLHQITWSRGKENVLQARKLSCLKKKCKNTKCKHYHIATVHIPNKNCLSEKLGTKAGKRAVVNESAHAAAIGEMRKAYHKLSLLCHPDRVDESEKLEATEKFKILGKVHSILSDPEKRSIYDETGIWGDDDDDGGAFENCDWLEYWRLLFKKITIADIQKYEQEYKGSDDELRDLKKTYTNFKGDMDRIYECVPFVTLDDEERIRRRLQELIDLEELPSYELFTKEPSDKREKRIRKLKKEEKEAEEESKNKKLKGDENGMDDLAQAILARRQISTDNFLDALEKKYSSGNKKKRAARGRKSKA